MVTMYPVIVPTNTNTHSDTSLVQKCIEEEGNSDILKKFISQEQLSEEEEDRIIECVNSKREKNNRITGAMITVVALVVLAMIVLTVWTFVATR